MFGLFKKKKEEPEKEVENKYQNDFIDPYSYCLVNPYFKSSENFSKFSRILKIEYLVYRDILKQIRYILKII